MFQNLELFADHAVPKCNVCVKFICFCFLLRGLLFSLNLIGEIGGILSPDHEVPFNPIIWPIVQCREFSWNTIHGSCEALLAIDMGWSGLVFPLSELIDHFSQL